MTLSPSPVHVHPSKNITPAQRLQSSLTRQPPRRSLHRPRSHLRDSLDDGLDLEAFSPCGRPDPGSALPRVAQSLFLPWASASPSRCVHIIRVPASMPKQRPTFPSDPRDSHLATAVARPQPSLRERAPNTNRTSLNASSAALDPALRWPSNRASSGRGIEGRLSGGSRGE